jgi:hypothetical protein
MCVCVWVCRHVCVSVGEGVEACVCARVLGAWHDECTRRGCRAARQQHCVHVASHQALLAKPHCTHTQRFSHQSHAGCSRVQPSQTHGAAEQTLRPPGKGMWVGCVGVGVVWSEQLQVVR